MLEEKKNRNHCKEILESNPLFKKLCLRNTTTGNKKISSLLNSIQNHKGISSLNLSFGTQHDLNELLTFNTSLKKLNLSKCESDVFSYLKKGLEINETLTHLNFNGCRIKEKRGEQIDSIIYFLTHKRWEHLDLSEVNLKDEELRRVFDCLKQNKYLKFVHIDSDQFKLKTIHYALDCLKSNDTLVTLRLVAINTCFFNFCELLKVNHSICYTNSHFPNDIMNNKVKKFLSVNRRISENPCWTPQKHFLFEKELRRNIETFLISSNIFFRNKKYLKIPKPLLYQIFDIFSIQFLLQSKNQIQIKNTNKRKI
eukprot:TRINITY_DN10534_c0_g1_i1.p1 TRINITY_DN10534_c0_g1~~TRINITY_DN10534_c0_g1_i1.p1  ORF type:complete len:311 (+),score=82.25 TRINITY_DN10534_c0_g1_i1:3-935(+)